MNGLDAHTWQPCYVIRRRMTIDGTLARGFLMRRKIKVIWPITDNQWQYRRMTKAEEGQDWAVEH